MVKPGYRTRQPPSQAASVPNACRKPLHVRPRAPAIKKRMVRFLLEYMTSDCFMYGPLLTPSSARKNSGLLKFVETFDVPGLNSPAADQQGASTLSSLHTPPSTPISRFRSMGTITRRILGRASPENKQNRCTIQAPFEMQHKLGHDLPSSTLKTKTFHKNEANRNDLLDSEREDEEANKSFQENESSKSLSESQSDQNIHPLTNESATEVARRLVRKVGGRFSKELGIFVDGRDSEVERWFLATTFFNQLSDFEQSKTMFKKLQNLGISKVQDVLSVNQSELEEAFESAMHKHRIASRLQKLALHFHTVNGNGICSFKRVPEYPELKRDLESLSGYSRHAANTFMREMRGVWPGANPDFEVRTRNAAKHLHLLSSNNDGMTATSTLVKLGQEAGLDARDLELALLKVSFLHARQYRNCPGGRDCEYARITLSDVDNLIANL